MYAMGATIETGMAGLLFFLPFFLPNVFTSFSEVCESRHVAAGFALFASSEPSPSPS
jgi:hypothetical protein